MGRIVKTSFEADKAGRQATLYTITNAQNASVTVCDFGGIITSLIVPDRDGRMTDVVLGYQHLAGYEDSTTYFGALIGRYANRIAKGRFEVGGKNYQVAVNNGENHLHGGKVGFDSRFWEVNVVDGGLQLTLESAHMEEHYPGNMKVKVIYTLDDDNCLTISYEAVSDQDTLCNLTNHSYFNLNGHESGSVEGQMVKLNASSFTPTDAGSIPTGEIRSVEGIPFDFRGYKRIGKDIEESCEQLDFAGGFDHNFVLDKESEELAVAAQAYSATSGISMICETTQPGIQFYTGNYINAQDPVGKDGACYGKRHGFCLETQGFPDAINHDNFPSVVLKAGEQYKEVTKYCFGIVQK